MCTPVVVMFFVPAADVNKMAAVPIASAAHALGWRFTGAAAAWP